MEILMLVIILVFFVLISNKIDSKSADIEAHFSRLNDRLTDLEKLIMYQKTSIPQESKQSAEIKSPIVEKQIIEDKPPIILENIPILEEVQERVEEQTATPVFAFDDATTPEPVHQNVEYVPETPQQTWWERFKEDNPDLERFIGENLINKIGILILVLGISYFVKFSIDKGWINEPARVGIGILSGAIVMAIAHRLRQQYAAFSSVFVAGAIAIFYFTIAIAFHSYHLLSQTAAFALMVVITIFSCFVSLSYNRKELAVLSLIGGFAVPFMVSTGQGNYVVLFTYITILDLGILAMAYYKKWEIINILSYLFTVVLFGGWFSREMSGDTPQYLGALCFGFVFYLIFVMTNIINNIRTKGAFTTIELSILVSNTFLFYAVGMIVLNHYHPEFRGLFTTALALLNLIYAWFLYKKFGLDKTAVYLLIGLTLTFMTLAIPIQFKGNYITLFWAAEAVMLMWLAQKSKIAGYRFSSIIVTILMLCSLMMDWRLNYVFELDFPIFINKICMTGVFAVACLSAIYYLLKDETANSEQFGFVFNPFEYRKHLTHAAILVGYIVGFLEINFQAQKHVLGESSAISVVILYHLLFCAVLFWFLCKSKSISNYRIATILGVGNIILFAFLFSNFPFYENRDYLTGILTNRLGFILHYISLAIVCYFGFFTYKINKENNVFDAFKSDKVLWVGVFLIVYLTSSELMLHALHFSTNVISDIEVKASPLNTPDAGYSVEDMKMALATTQIKSVATQINKAGYPVLWGFLAFLFLILGIKRQNKTLRIAALVLLGLTIVKLFLFDIQNASETGKIIAFILLGILILVISFVYQKIKVLVLDDNKKTDETDENV